MTKEEKQLLLKDLSARLPYGVKYNYGANEGCDYTMDRISLIAVDDAFPLEDVKPYLRSMETMTKEEIERCSQLQENTIHIRFYKYDDGYEKTIDLPYFEILVDFFNSHYLDFRGLIPMGLALEAPEDMYK